MSAWMSRHRWPLAAFALTLVVYGAVAGNRLRRRSTDPHFMAQAAAWLSGRLDIERWPPNADDPAKVEVVRLKDGREVRGRRLTTRPVFRIAGGGEIPTADIAESVRTVHYNSFPPVPSLFMIPQALLHGEYGNDVGTTVVLGALIPAMLLVLLARLRAAGLSTRTVRDDLWLAALLSFGSVLFFSAVQGRVWFTAHVVAVLLATAYVWASIEASRPVLAGLFLGLAVGTRPPMLFMAPLFLWEAWRGDPALRVRRVVAFALPMAVIGAILAWYNLARFGELTEFGHSYLYVRQQAQIEKHGLFDVAYLARNLAVALTLLPDFVPRAPYVSIDGHGLALWVTTPALILLAWPHVRNRWHPVVWTCVAAIALWTLSYQNSGWIQFGYRFSLDYMVLLVVLLAIGGRPLGIPTRTLIVIGIVVNLFGAITFARIGHVYRTDNASYDCVVPH
jgi:hypothetical protein